MQHRRAKQCTLGMILIFALLRCGRQNREIQQGNQDDLPTSVSSRLVADPQTLFCEINQSIPLSLIGNARRAIIETPPLHGTITGIGSNLTYTPNTSFTGTDTFQYSVADETEKSEPAEVSIRVAWDVRFEDASSDDGLTVTSTSPAQQLFQASRENMTGDRYFEVTSNTDADFSKSSVLLVFHPCIGGPHNYYMGVPSPIVKGDIFSLSVDRANGRITSRMNGELVHEVPIALECPGSTPMITTDLSTFSAGRSWTANFGRSPFQFEAPAGFLSLVD